MDDPVLAVRALVVEAAAELNHNEIGRAQELFGAALQQAAASVNRYYEAAALSNLSACSKRLNRYEESIAFGRRALEAAQKAGAQRTIAT